MTNVVVYSVGTTLVAVLLNNELVDCLMDNVGISRVEVLTVLRNIIIIAFHVYHKLARAL